MRNPGCFKSDSVFVDIHCSSETRGEKERDRDSNREISNYRDIGIGVTTALFTQCCRNESKMKRGRGQERDLDREI